MGFAVPAAMKAAFSCTEGSRTMLDRLLKIAGLVLLLLFIIAIAWSLYEERILALVP